MKNRRASHHMEIGPVWWYHLLPYQPQQSPLSFKRGGKTKTRTCCHDNPIQLSERRKDKAKEDCHDKDKGKMKFSPHGDGTSVVVPPLAIPTPVIPIQL